MFSTTGPNSGISTSSKKAIEAQIMSVGSLVSFMIWRDLLQSIRTGVADVKSSSVGRKYSENEWKDLNPVLVDEPKAEQIEALIANYTPRDRRTNAKAGNATLLQRVSLSVGNAAKRYSERDFKGVVSEGAGVIVELATLAVLGDRLTSPGEYVSNLEPTEQNYKALQSILLRQLNSLRVSHPRHQAVSSLTERQRSFIDTVNVEKLHACFKDSMVLLVVQVGSSERGSYEETLVSNLDQLFKDSLTKKPDLNELNGISTQTLRQAEELRSSNTNRALLFDIFGRFADGLRVTMGVSDEPAELLRSEYGILLTDVVRLVGKSAQDEAAMTVVKNSGSKTDIWKISRLARYTAIEDELKRQVEYLRL